MERERKRKSWEEGMKGTQCCVKLFPHRREVDKKTLSKPLRALPSDGQRGLMKENKGKREREGETGKKEERERERTGDRGHTVRTENNAVSYFLPSPSTFPHFHDFMVV